MALLLCALAVPAFASVDGDLKGYGESLARENGASVGGAISKGDGANQYQLGSTSASGGRDLYVIEIQTTVSYERIAGGGDNCHMDAALFYLGSDNKLYWTDDFNYNDYSEKFMSHTSALVEGQSDNLSIQLPRNFRKFVAVYFHKSGGAIQGKYEWAASTLRISRVSGSIGNKGKDASGYEYRDYSGHYVAGVNNLNELNYNGWGNYVWRLNGVTDSANTSCAKSVFVVELVAGSDGYPNRPGSVTLDYTDCLGLPCQRVLTFDDAYETLFPGSQVKNSEFTFDNSITSPWLSTSIREMNGLAAGYTSNYYPYDDISDTNLLPYTASSLAFVMPQNFSRINSITVKLDQNDNLILQSLRLYELSSLGDNYWNGSFSLERTNGWQGRLLARSTGNEQYTVNGNSSITFTAGQSFATRGLETFARGKGTAVDNRGSNVAVSLQFADVEGAGIDAYIAYNNRDGVATVNPDCLPPSAQFLGEQAGEDAALAYRNLGPCRPECLTLQIAYKDVFGAVRMVSIPFVTTYLTYLIKENRGKLTGGSTDTWISGVLQQNENAGLPVRLAQYQSLISVKLTYGKTPYGLASYQSIAAAGDPFTLENICFYEGVTSSNFTSKYDSNKLTCMLSTSLTPAYSWSASGQGQQLSPGGSITASLEGGSLTPGAPAKLRDYSSKYLVKIKTADIETAGTVNPVTVSLAYTDTAGAQKTTSVYSLPSLAAGYYGLSYREAANNYQYERHMRRNCLCEFTLDIPDAASIDAISLSIEGSNEWQVEYVSVYKISSLEQRWGERSDAGNNKSHIYWRREYDDDNMVAHVRQSVLLYSNNPSKTLSFTTYDSQGNEHPPEQTVKQEEFLTSLPSSMTFEETKKNLGLAIVKCTYQISVNVADVEDAGSGNYFYFQLVFENGTSAVVLANQQLASDSFRQGTTETFQIKTTQNYGNVKAVRIICDNTSSTSDVFDKLNIESISVTLNSNTGISKSWLVEKVGWIDITYVDEGADYGVDGMGELEEFSGANVELLKEFAVTRTATAVDLLFCISTAPNSTDDPSNPLDNILQGKFEATLVYRDSDGVEQNMNFDLTAKIQEYNDTNKTFWLYRPNHVDRFTLSMTDISSVQGLIITRTDGKENWIVSSVSIQQIGGLGSVYLSPVLTEYYRDTENAVDLAVSTNESSITYTISGGGSASISFTENAIDVISLEDSNAWNANITRVPVSASEELNIILFAGGVMGQNYTFTSSSPAIRATVKYTTIYGGSLVQNAFVLGNLGELDGQRVLYGKGLPVSAMSSLSSLLLSTTSASGNQPYIRSAIVQRVRDDVVMGEYYFDYGNYYLGNGNPESPPATTVSAAVPMRQTLRLQPAASQAAGLTAQTSDIAVALRYTSTLDPAGRKSVYQSPYVYLTDGGYTTVTTGQGLELNFNLSGVDEIVGLSVVSSGPVAAFDNAVAYNWSVPDSSQPAALLGAGYFPESFTASAMQSVLTASEETVVPVLLRFTTPAEEVVHGAAPGGQVDMRVRYVDNDGEKREMEFPDLTRWLSQGTAPAAGSTAEASFLLNDAAYLEEIVLTAEDAWFLSNISAQLTLPEGEVNVSTTVNNWAGEDALRVDLRPDSQRDAPNTGNVIQSFSVMGRAQRSGASASAASGASLLVTAYPGDTVYLTPVTTVIGNPDASWSWNPSGYEGNLTVHGDGTAAFFIPHSMSPGDSCTFSVSCNGDNRLTVTVTVLVEAEPIPEPEPVPDWDNDPFGSGGGEGGGAGGDETGGGDTGGDAGGGDTGGGAGGGDTDGGDTGGGE